MSATVTPIDAKRKREAASLKYQALMLALMNEEKATYCTKEQAALRTFLEMNAKLLRALAQ